MVPRGVVSQSRRCLRNQLRDVLRRTGPSTIFHASHQHFSTAPPGRNAAAAPSTEPLVDATEGHSGGTVKDEKVSRGIVRKSHNPGGKILGKEGRKQRFISQRITRDSLNKPYFILVPKDVDGVTPKPQGQRQRKGERLRVGEQGDEPAAITDQGVTANQIIDVQASPQSSKASEQEVYASIDALKPLSPVLEKSEFDRLRETILQSYTGRQLRNYLVAPKRRARTRRARGAASPDLEAEIPDLDFGQWHKGTTPIELRHKVVVVKPDSKKKENLADQVLRVAWNLQIASEEQELGEVEVHLKTWQLRLLFDTHIRGGPQYQSLISPALLRASDVRPFRPDNILRITARRQDADDIARRLKLALHHADRKALDLKRFAPRLATPGWPTELDEIISDRDLDAVSETTHALVMREDEGILGIYACGEQDWERTANARQLLLSLFPHSPPTSFDKVVSPSLMHDTSTRALAPFPVPSPPMDTRLRRQYERYRLARLVQPTASKSSDNLTSAAEEENTLSVIDDTLVHLIASELRSVPPVYAGRTAFAASAGRSFWGPTLHLHHMPWKVHFCKLLQEREVDGSFSRKERFVTPLHDVVPGAEKVLSYLSDAGSGKEPFDQAFSRARSSLIVSFLPSPFTAKGPEIALKLPRLEFNFKIVAGPNPLQLYGLRAIVDEQNIKIPLPDHAVDLLFTRQILLFANKRKVADYSHVATFIKALQKSYNEGGDLRTPPAIRMFLPSWMLSGDHPGEGGSDRDEPVDYIFDRFEQDQPYSLRATEDASSLAPLAPEDRAALQSVPHDAWLEYRQVEGPAYAGEKTFFTIRKRVYSRMRSVSLHPREDSAGALANEHRPERPGAGHHDTSDAAATDPDLAPFGQFEDAEYIGQLASSSLRVARLLTRADAGLLPTLAKSQAQARREQWERSGGVDDANADRRGEEDVAIRAGHDERASGADGRGEGEEEEEEEEEEVEERLQERAPVPSS